MRGHISSYTTKTRGRLWRAVWHQDGIRHDKRGFETKREAEVFVGRQIHGDEPVERTSPVPFGDYMTGRWLRAIRPTVRPNTFRNYESQHRLHLAPHLGDVPLDQLTLDNTSAALTSLSESLAPSTVRNIGTMLRQALDDAVKWQLLTVNPAAAVTLPQTSGETVQAWSAEELGRFLDAASGDRLEPLWTVLATTGLRRGEALGLRWDAVDLDGPQVSVVGNLTMVDGLPTVGRPKTKASVRTFRLDRATAAMLRSHRARQASERLAAGAAWRDTGLVFVRPDGTPIRPDQLSRTFTRIAGRLELPPIGLHGLRHSCATIALRSGVAMKVVSHRLGHASIQTTIDLYAHVAPAWDQEAADMTAAAIFGQRGVR